MLKENVVSVCEKWGFDIGQYKNTVLDIGDTCAIRKDKQGTFRRNFERGILLLAVAIHYKVVKCLEFGTGRGFASACISLAPTVDRIITIDSLAKEKTVDVIGRVSCVNIDTSKILFISANSKKLKPKNIGESFDFVFIDGEHSFEGVRNDFLLALECSTPDAVIVFDDYRNKHRGVKKYIKSLEYDKMLVSSDGWIYRNERLKFHGDADKIVGGKESGSGQVILYRGGYRE